MTLKQSPAMHIQASYSADVILPGSSSKLRLLVINLASVPGGQLVNSPTAQSLERWLQGKTENFHSLDHCSDSFRFLKIFVDKMFRWFWY
jgi:hypothetical protein